MIIIQTQKTFYRVQHVISVNTKALDSHTIYMNIYWPNAIEIVKVIKQIEV